MENITPETRVFFVVDSPEVNGDLFATWGEACESFQMLGAGSRIRIALVDSAYQIPCGCWDYSGDHEAFVILATICTASGPEQRPDECGHTAAFCSVPGCGQEADRWFEFPGVPDETFYVCDTHRETLSPGDDVVRLLTPDRQPVELELACYACSDDCPACWD